MKLFKLAIIAAAISLFIMACDNTTNTNQTSNQTAQLAKPSPAASNAATPSPTDALMHARANYAKHCEECHGANADGGTVKIQDLTLKVPSLKAGHALRHTDEQFARQITKGGDGMPAFNEKLSTEEINELVRFIRQEFQQGATGSAQSNTNSKPARNSSH